MVKNDTTEGKYSSCQDQRGLSGFLDIVHDQYYTIQTRGNGSCFEIQRSKLIYSIAKVAYILGNIDPMVYTLLSLHRGGSGITLDGESNTMPFLLTSVIYLCIHWDRNGEVIRRLGWK